MYDICGHTSGATVTKPLSHFSSLFFLKEATGMWIKQWRAALVMGHKPFLWEWVTFHNRKYMWKHASLFKFATHGMGCHRKFTSWAIVPCCGDIYNKNLLEKLIYKELWNRLLIARWGKVCYYLVEGGWFVTDLLFFFFIYKTHCHYSENFLRTEL